MGIKSIFTSLMRGRDLFGQPILMSFNKKGNTHNTVCGGCISLIVQVALTAYFIIHLFKMIFYQDDKIASKTTSINLDEQDIMTTTEMNW